LLISAGTIHIKHLYTLYCRCIYQRLHKFRYVKFTQTKRTRYIWDHIYNRYVW